MDLTRQTDTERINRAFGYIHSLERRMDLHGDIVTALRNQIEYLESEIEILNAKLSGSPGAKVVRLPVLRPKDIS